MQEKPENVRPLPKPIVRALVVFYLPAPPPLRVLARKWIIGLIPVSPPRGGEKRKVFNNCKLSSR